VMNRSVMTQSIVERAMGILQLDDATYESIEHDTSATTQAAIIVVLAGIAGGIGAVRDSGWSLIASPIGALIGWAVASFFIFFVGTRLIPSGQTEADLGQVLRLYGFASVPSIANVLGFIPVIGAIVGLIAAIWGIVCAVKAIKHALEMSTGRAIATGILAAIVAGLVLAIIGGIFGVTLLAFT
jgi:hypothetical protein